MNKPEATLYVSCEWDSQEWAPLEVRALGELPKEVVMNTNINNEDPNVSVEMLAALGGPNLVYIREVEAAELSGSVPDDVLEVGEKFYAVHSADGTRVAVLNDRDAAFLAARQNDMEPVSVH
jgi:hypothetical protein